MKYFVIMVALFASCSPSSEHGHSHGTDGGNPHESDGRPLLDVTVRTDDIELFVKFNALITGSTSTFETYITHLDGFRPVDDVNVTVSLVKGSNGIRHSVNNPNKNGVFLPALRPNKSGIYQLIYELEAPDFQERLELGDVRVFSDLEELQGSFGHIHDNESGITFTKQQAWEIEFSTETVLEGEIFEVINTSGIWKAAPGDSKSLVANASGIINFNRDNLTVGTSVKKGQPLMTITSKGLTTNNLEVEIEKAKADHNQITAEYERQKILFESNLIPKAEYERSESKYLVSKASIESLQQGYKDGGKQIEVPFDGFVNSIEIHNGDYVIQGASLFSVVSSHSQLLETQVSPAYSLSMEDIEDIWFKHRSGNWYSMKQSGGSVLSIGKKVSMERPLIPVFAKMNTPVDRPQGSFTEVQISIGASVPALIVSETALLEDYGKYSVIVQVSGQTYVQRPIMVGRRNGASVEVTRGLKKGEIVVTQGAYQVKMASLSTSVPAHGHQH